MGVWVSVCVRLRDMHVSTIHVLEVRVRGKSTPYSLTCTQASYTTTVNMIRHFCDGRAPTDIVGVFIPCANSDDSRVTPLTAAGLRDFLWRVNYDLENPERTGMLQRLSEDMPSQIVTRASWRRIQPEERAAMRQQVLWESGVVVMCISAYFGPVGNC